MRTVSRLIILALVSTFISACTVQSPHRPLTASDTLGTQWGEGVQSDSSSIALSRQSQEPVAVQIIQYLASHPHGRKVKELQLDGGRIGLAILDEHGNKLDLAEKPGHSQLQGRNGDRYRIWLANYGSATYEIVTTVDGIDVINGTPGSFKNRGYVLYPGKTMVIEGFRKSSSEVAVFRFAAPDRAYAANTPAGDVDNLGTIGMAAFTLKAPSPHDSTDTSRAFPADNRFAPPPRYTD